MSDESTPAAEPDPPKPPTRGAASFVCPRCGAMAHQLWSQIYRDDDENTGPFGEGTVTELLDSRSPSMRELIGELPRSDRWGASRCHACKEWSVWRGPRIIFPAVGPSSIPRAHAEMPPEVVDLYNEAREVMPISRRAGAALARAALERLLRHLDPDAGRIDLAKRIERMLSHVSPELGDGLTIVRHAGNKSLHVEDAPDDLLVMVLDPDDEEIAGLLFESVNDLVEERIARPARRQAAYDKVPQHIRDEVDRKRAQQPPRK